MTIFILYVLIAPIVVIAAAVAGKKYDFAFPLALMASFVILSDLLANKITSIGSLNVPAGIIVFSSAYLLSNIIGEFWGKRVAVIAILGGFMANMVAAACIYATIHLPSAPYATASADAFAAALGMTPRLVFASFFSYIVSQYVDISGFFYLRRLTAGRHLWIRTTFSILVAQMTSTVLFVCIAFYGVFPIEKLIASVFIMKVILLAVDVPFMYAARKLIVTLTGSTPVPVEVVPARTSGAAL